MMIEKLLAEGGLSFDRLAAFAQVAEKGSIAAVAPDDPSRQSQISRQIKELEQFFAVELTRRQGRGLKLTPAGKELAGLIRLHFAALSDFKDAQRVSRLPEVRIGAGNSLLDWRVIPALPEIRIAWPRSEFSLIQQRTRALVEALQTHELDFALLRAEVIHPPLDSASIGRIGYRLFVPPALARTPLGQLPIAVKLGGTFMSHWSQAVAQLPEPPIPCVRCTSFTQAAQLVRDGVCAAVLPETASQVLGSGFLSRKLPWFQHQRQIHLAWHPRLLASRPQLAKLRPILLKSLKAPTP